MRLWSVIMACLVCGIALAGQPDMKSMTNAKGQCLEGNTYCDCVAQQCNDCLPAGNATPSQACQKTCQEADSCTDSSVD